MALIPTARIHVPTPKCPARLLFKKVKLGCKMRARTCRYPKTNRFLRKSMGDRWDRRKVISHIHWGIGAAKRLLTCDCLPISKTTWPGEAKICLPKKCIFAYRLQGSCERIGIEIFCFTDFYRTIFVFCYSVSISANN